MKKNIKKIKEESNDFKKTDPFRKWIDKGLRIIQKEGSKVNEL